MAATDTRFAGDSLLAAVLTSGGDRRLRWLGSTTPIVLLGGAWAAAHLGGGSGTALPHLFYVPILVASVTMGARGGALAGVVATMLAGPLLPLDVAAGVMQPAANWILRGVFFVGIGAGAGYGLQASRRVYEEAIERILRDELRRSSPGGPAVVSPSTAVEVRRLLDARAFHTVFQPIHRLADGRVVAVEALARFHSEPYRSPDVWFERAAAAGIGVELELATARAAFEAVADDELPADVALSINVSPPLLVDERLRALLDEHDERTVVLEVTEHAIVEDYHELDRAMTGLRERGVQLAVDDAGAGFASLRHIVRLGPEVIKLDMSLTQGLGTDPVRTALADCLVDFAHRTGTMLVAEGMEHPADLAAWRELGADAAQGYLLGRPCPLPRAAADRRIA